MSFAEAAPSGESAETFQTFENFDDAEVSGEEDSSEDWAKEEPIKEPKPKDEGIKVLKDSEVDGEGKVVKDEGKKFKKESVKKEESFDDEEVEEEKPLEDQPIHEKSEDKDNKKLRMRMGDDLFNVSSDATFKVKVDGEMQEVTAQELINNYSGKTAWDKKFTEIGKEKKAIEFEKNQIKGQKDKLLEHLNMALGPIKDVNKNPIDSLLYLVEMSGEDPYAAYRRIMEANLDELGSLMDMSETERELFFHKKKDELHSNVAKKRQEKSAKDEAFNQAIQKVDQLRQTFKVSEEEFLEASEELESIYKNSGLDVNSITEEAIVDYSSLKPHIAKVKELIEPYEDNISEGKYGDVVSELSRYLRDGKADEATVKNILKRNFSVEEDVKELNTKIYRKNEVKSSSKKVLKETPSDLESFDDWN